MKKIILAFLGLALFLYIVLSVGLESIVQSLLGLDPVLLAIAVVLILPEVLLKGFKQRMLVSAFRQGTSLLENTKLWLISFFFGTASPAKSGEAARALYLKKAFGISLGQGLAVVFVERVADLAVLFALALIGFSLLALPAETGATVLFSIALLLAIFVLVLVFVFKKEAVKFVARPFFNRFAPERFKQGLREGFADFYKAISFYLGNPRTLLKFGIVTLLSWTVIFVQFYIVSLALSMNVNFIAFVFAFPVVVLVEAIPASISGIGTRDAAAVLMFGTLGVEPAIAVSFALTILAFNLISAFVGFLAFNSTEKPI